MQAPAAIERKRLLLRRPQETDGPALFQAYGADPQATRFLTWRPKQQAGEMTEFIARTINDWDDGTGFHWVLVPADVGAPVGMVSAELAHGVELGYVLAVAHQGRGLMTEAVTAVTEWAERQAEIHRVWATCDTENTPSARLLRRCGFQEEGVLRRWAVHPNVSPEPRDSHVFARVRA